MYAKKVKEKRADEELKRFMIDWSEAKCNYESESMRKRECMRVALK